jgi:hypothetical protein
MANPPVSFHDDPNPATTSRYKSVIEQAKAKQRQRPGDLENVPRFDQVSNSWEQAPVGGPAAQTPKKEQRGLSKETEQQLSDFIAETSAQAAKAEDTVAEAAAETETAEPMSPEDKLRKVMESRLTPIDIGEYLMRGEAHQKVVIIPNKLEVIFRTVSEFEEVYVDEQLSKEKDVSTRQFLRRSNEWALATHIFSVNGQKWPLVNEADGTINDASMQRRLAHVRKLSSPIFVLLVQNLGWFLERVQESLTLEALGNG